MIKMYCENCGLEIDENTIFCPKCGFNIKKVCPKCGENIENSENFCENCGANLTSKTPETFNQKYGRSLIPVALFIIALIGATAFYVISDGTFETQIVSIDSLDVKIPANFEYDSIASDKFIDEKATHKNWEHNGQTIELAVITYDEGSDADRLIANLGGNKENMYGISGYHNYFQDGGQAFSFGRGNKMYTIMVSDESLFDKIEII